MKTFSPGLINPSSRLRDLFNGSGVVAQAPRLVGQARVVGALARDRGRQLVVLAPCSQRGEQPAIADERVQRNHADDQQQEHAADASGWRAIRALSGLFLVVRSEY